MKIRSSSTTITPVKLASSATQQTRKSTKQQSSQRTPSRVHSTSTQVNPQRHSFGTQSVPSTSNKSVNTSIQFNQRKDKGIQVQCPPMDIKICKKSDKDIKLNTGFNTYALFNIVYNYVKSPCDEEGCQVEAHRLNPCTAFPSIDSENQFFIVMYKLWQNPTDKKVAEDFGISVATVSRLFHFWNERMFRKFKILNLCPSLEKLQQYMTNQVTEKWPNLREIYDGTEFKCQKPSDPFTQRQMWSNYKHDNTVKVQIGCTSTGVITSVSDTYGGSVSDKELFIRSGVIEHLNPQEAIMVDKGFLIHDILQGSGVELIRPPFLSSNTQFEMEERDSGREISKARIVVENVNSRLKKFGILSKRVNIKYLPKINEIVFNCCNLCNFAPPLRSNIVK